MVREQVKARTIVRDPDILRSEPIMEGTRISVRHIVLTMLDCQSTQAVAEEYPPLTAADVEAALRFYHERHNEIDLYIVENNEGEDIPFDHLHRL